MLNLDYIWPRTGILAHFPGTIQNMIYLLLQRCDIMPGTLGVDLSLSLSLSLLLSLSLSISVCPSLGLSFSLSLPLSACLTLSPSLPPSLLFSPSISLSFSLSLYPLNCKINSGKQAGASVNMLKFHSPRNTHHQTL